MWMDGVRFMLSVHGTDPLSRGYGSTMGMMGGACNC